MPFFTFQIVAYRKQKILYFSPQIYTFRPQLFSMEVICLEDAAFYELVDRVLERIKEKQKVVSDKWISGEETMKMLRISSKTTLQKLRDEGKIRFSQPEKKLILYDFDSINNYLNQNAHSTF